MEWFNGYRFKTKKEFRDEFGENWRNTVNFNRQGEMDYLCGVHISDCNITYFDDNCFFIEKVTARNLFDFTWSINKLMIKKLTNEEKDLTEEEEYVECQQTVSFDFLL